MFYEQDDRLHQEFPDLIRGNSYPIEVDFTDENDQSLDVSGKTLYITLKESPDLPDDQALLQLDFALTETNGEVKRTITPRQTLKLPAARLWMDLKLIEGEDTAITIVGGRVPVRNSATWAVGPDQTPPQLYLPASVSLEYPKNTDGLSQTDPALIAVIDGLVAVDNVDGLLPVTADLTGLADPIPAGTHTVPVSAEDAAGNEATGSFNLIVSESQTTGALAVLEQWTFSDFEVAA